MTDIHDRLKWAREQAGFATAADAADAMGVPRPTYSAHENGSRGFKRDSAQAYAKKFKISLDWLLTERGSPKSNWQTKALGYVGAGAEVRPIDDHAQGAGLEEVDVPPGVPINAALVIVKGDSMYPRYFDGEMLFYVKEDRDPGELVGRECVVSLKDGRMFVKMLRSGSRQKRFDLESWNAPVIENAHVEWAAPVIARVNRRKVA